MYIKSHYVCVSGCGKTAVDGHGSYIIIRSIKYVSSGDGFGSHDIKSPLDLEDALMDGKDGSSVGISNTLAYSVLLDATKVNVYLCIIT